MGATGPVQCHLRPPALQGGPRSLTIRWADALDTGPVSATFSPETSDAGAAAVTSAVDWSPCWIWSPSAGARVFAAAGSAVLCVAGTTDGWPLGVSPG